MESKNHYKICAYTLAIEMIMRNRIKVVGNKDYDFSDAEIIKVNAELDKILDTIKSKRQQLHAR